MQLVFRIHYILHWCIIVKACNINKKAAKTIGIAVDYRRRNKSAESMALNVRRLKEYLAKVVIMVEDPKGVCSGKLVRAIYL